MNKYLISLLLLGPLYPSMQLGMEKKSQQLPVFLEMVEKEEKRQK